MRIPFFGSSSEPSALAGSSSASGSAGIVPPAEVPASPPTVNRFESVLHDEEKYQELQYPTFEDVPGCMRLLDEFLMCYALVPQLRNMYRHGEFRDCTWKFQDFKYCLSMKSETPEARRDLWVKRRADWWARRRVGGSSEDVWDIRSEKLENFPPLAAEDVSSETSTT
ncbi:hypothetical protein IAR55_006963 [Kwoniella newhampshirensis]|uniref:Early meiotic induction protein 1 n=1 Tax=Kwoniella newhampshirensis TaxID=1651941 RepID=A0AAW0YU18_9TREE